MNLPTNIPAGIRANIERMARAIQTDKFAVAAIEQDGEVTYAFCSVEQGKEPEPVIRVLCEIVDANLPHEQNAISMKRANPKNRA